MRRIMVLISAVAVLLAGFVIAGSLVGGTAAQDATPAAVDRHPLIGTWLVDANADDPANSPEVDRFSADGGFVSVTADEYPSLGLWEATGERTAISTFVSTWMDEAGGYAGTFTIRAAIEVDASGDAFTAEYTFEFVGPDGTASGEFGPGRATGTRISAEGPGTPVGPISALFGDESAGTPEAATPAP